jgi:NAD(P)-dependent dehydrogenase (short-subunit alcohol dehydrogenase family)
MAKVWLVTGSGNGLGRSIVEAALAAGESVVAGARRIAELDPLVAQFGARIKPVTLEVRDEAQAKAAVAAAVETFGRLDVLVNNAGYGEFAPFEQISAEDFKAIVDTCFYGVVFTTRAAVPVMRRQKSGHIFQVSSIGGRLAFAGNTPYHAAKWAVGGFSDALAMEVAPFGVKVCTLEPGGIRTNWARRAGQNVPELIPDYEPSVGPILKLLHSIQGRSEGDPNKIADLVVRLAHSDDVPVRLILGVDAEKRVQFVEAARAREAEKSDAVYGLRGCGADSRVTQSLSGSGAALRRVICWRADNPLCNRAKSEGPRTRAAPLSFVEICITPARQADAAREAAVARPASAWAGLCGSAPELRAESCLPCAA